MPSRRRRRSVWGHRSPPLEPPRETAKFELSPDTIVIDDLDRPLAPGSGEVGRLAVGGRQPVGYYKDPGEERPDVLRGRGQALFVSGRLRDDRRRRQDHPPRAWLAVHQHRRREGVPGRGRRGDEDAPRCARRRCGRRSRREVRRSGHRRGRGAARRHHRCRGGDRPREARRWRPTRRRSGSSSSTPSGEPPTARSTTSGCEVKQPRPSRSADRTLR